MKRILNLGCASTPFKDTKSTRYDNLDILELPPTEGINYTKRNLLDLPYAIFADETFDEIWMFHVIEHILEVDHHKIVQEMYRLIKPDGRIIFAYPEFLKCADNYRTNKENRRDFWKATIYGRGWTIEDSHRALMDTPYFIKFLATFGLKTIKALPEKHEPHNTIVVCKRGEPTLSYEDLMGREFK